MKIIDIEVIPISLPLSSRYDNAAGRLRMYDIDQQVAVKIHTDAGITGHGSYEDRPDIAPSEIEPLIDTNPFDHLHNDYNLAIGMALYDVMGKYLEVPAYKLMGRKVRDAAPVAAWTRPCAPDVFAAEVARAVEQGYRIFKMHTDPRFDVIEQTKAAEQVAPPGFRIHWDMNHSRTSSVVLPLIAELEKHSIVGFIEDPLPWTDIEGWRALRAKSRVPLVMHNPQLGGIQEVMHGCADVYMVGGGIGKVLEHGFAYAKANAQVLIQQSGTALMRALSLHEAAVLPTASAHLITLDDQFEEDIVSPGIPVTGGFCRVPEEPGLGVEIDEAALQRASEREPLPRHEFIGIVHLPDERRLYTLDDGRRSVSGSNALPRILGIEEGDLKGIRFEAWEPDGSERYATLRARIQDEGIVIE